MKIAMFASEALPLSKTGGLADVTYALSKELVKGGDEVILVSPFYPCVRKKKYKFKHVSFMPVSLSWREQQAEILSTQIEGITYYLIENSYYFDRDNLYGYHDDCERFAFFALACMNLLKYLSFQADIIHVHDWQVGMVPTLLKEKYAQDPFYCKMKTVLTIHNPAFKGLVDRYFLHDFWGLDDSLFDSGRVRFDNMVSSLKAGIVDADKITTVSPTHR
ncbi:MAG TPA: starch synthase, partial [Firmicutes bacterium]|nr:starch synthase [Bacillota bacterium]